MILEDAKSKTLQLLQRASQFRMTDRDYQDFKILIARDHDPKIYAMIESRINHLELIQGFAPKREFDVPEQMKGDISLGFNGSVENHYDSKNAPYHLLGVGSTGFGKTVLLIHILLQYLMIAGGIWLFDFIKRELRGFKRLSEKSGKKVIVCRHENLRINLLDPQVVEPAQYANICSEFITLSLGLPPVAKLILKICITNLYQKSGLLKDGKALPPILEELIEEIKEFEGNSSAKEAILIRLKALLVNQRQVFNVRRGFKVSELAEKFIVWEFDGLETQYQNLFSMYLLSVLFALRTRRPSSKLTIVAFDEASRIYSKKAETANEGPSYISTMTSVVRGMNIGIMALTQSCHDLSNSIIANSGIKIMFRVGTPGDYETFGKVMDLTSDQIQYCKTRLDKGDSVVKMGFDYMKPFLNKCSFIKIPGNVSDIEVNQSMDELLSSVSEKVDVSMPQRSSVDNSAKSTPEQPSEFCDDENLLIEQIKNNPLVTSATDHYKAAGLSTKRGVAAKQSLISKRIIKETPLETGKRGAAKAFLEIVKPTGRYGGVLHNLLRNKAKAWYTSNSCKIEIEKTIMVNNQSQFVDMAIKWPSGTTEALEIETEDSSRVIENIRKNILAGFDSISILTPNSKVRTSIMDRVANELTGQHESKINFTTISLYEREG